MVHAFGCMCVCVCLVHLCRKGHCGVSHPPVIELAELQMNTHRGKREELNALPPTTGEHILATDEADCGSVTQILLK